MSQFSYYYNKYYLIFYIITSGSYFNHLDNNHPIWANLAIIITSIISYFIIILFYIITSGSYFNHLDNNHPYEPI